MATLNITTQIIEGCIAELSITKLHKSINCRTQLNNTELKGLIATFSMSLKCNDPDCGNFNCYAECRGTFEISMKFSTTFDSIILHMSK